MRRQREHPADQRSIDPLCGFVGQGGRFPSGGGRLGGQGHRLSVACPCVSRRACCTTRRSSTSRARATGSRKSARQAPDAQRAARRRGSPWRSRADRARWLPRRDHRLALGHRHDGLRTAHRGSLRAAATPTPLRPTNATRQFVVAVLKVDDPPVTWADRSPGRVQDVRSHDDRISRRCNAGNRVAGFDDPLDLPWLQ